MPVPNQLDISNTAHRLLSRYWGYDSFRPRQLDIITSVLQGHDTLGLLPTGGGKSITFQIPALALEGLTIVVTPLISLMKDQVDNLSDRGVRAAYIHSGLRPREQRIAIERCRLGKAKMLYVSPERLQAQSFVDALRTLDVSLIVVDEAHCISQWGYDFRPSYLKINLLRQRFPNAPVLALTASATPEVVADIMRELRFRDTEHVYSRSFSRDNISYVVRYCDHKEGMMLKVLRGVGGTAIVYVRSRRRTRELSELLLREGISADFYHAGLDPEEKEQRQDRWRRGTTRVMVATNAFGMGIDKADVRTVIHHDLPSSLEEYYQEAGRAGRDGLPSFAVLLVSKADKGVLTRRISETFPPKDFIARVYELAGNFLDVAVGSGYNQLYPFNFDKFVATFHLQPAQTRSALVILSQAGYIDYVDEVSTRSRVMILAKKHELYSLNIDPVSDAVLKQLLRAYPGLFADYVHIDEPSLSRALNITEEAVYQALLTLTRTHLLHYVPKQSTPYIYYSTSRELPRSLIIPIAVYEHRRERLEHRIRSMQRFAFATDQCRVNLMLRYFGETPTSPCGKCDVCRSQHPAKTPTPDPALPPVEESVKYLASQPGGHRLDHFITHISHPRELVIQTVRSMLDQGLLATGPDGRIILAKQ